MCCLAWAWWALACTPTTGSPIDVLTDGGPDVRVFDDAGDSVSVPMTSVQGSLMDANGLGIGGVTMTLCRIVCRTAVTDALGDFAFPVTEAVDQVLENLNYPGDDPVSAVASTPRVYRIVPIVGTDPVQLAPLVMRQVTAPSEVLTGPTHLELNGGLDVDFDADRLEHLPAPESLTLGAVAIPDPGWPQDGLMGWAIQGAWILAVWDVRVEGGFQVRAPLTVPLPPGTTVASLVADYTYGFLHGTFRAQAAPLSPEGRSIQTPEGDGSLRASLWLALAKPNQP